MTTQKAQLVAGARQSGQGSEKQEENSTSPISPPESVGVTLKLNIGIFFTQVNKVGAKYQRQKAYVQGGYQFLEKKNKKQN